MNNSTIKIPVKSNNWPIVFSILAIVISFSTLYYQFFHEKNDLRAYLIEHVNEDIQQQEKDAMDCCKDCDKKITFTFMLLNDGNRQSTLLSLELRKFNVNSNGILDIDSVIDFSKCYRLIVRQTSIDPKDSLNIKLPLLINPGEMSILKYIKYYNSQDSVKVLIKDNDSLQCTPLLFTFESMDSNGQMFTKRYISVMPDSNDISSINKTNKINLFSNNIDNPYHFQLTNNESHKYPQEIFIIIGLLLIIL